MKPIENLIFALQNTPWWIILIDVVIASLVIYGALLFLKRHSLLRLLKYAIPLIIASAIVAAYREYIPLSGFLVPVLLVVVMAIFVVGFINESKRGLLRMASPKKEAAHYNSGFRCSDAELATCVSELVKGIMALSKNNVGALIILQQGTIPSHIVDSGTRLDAIATSALIESIFNTRSPLHDGAVVVEDNRVMAAGCFLPLSQSLNLPRELGTRHRAGIGITENAKVVSLIVSEETGVISIAKNGAITRYYDVKMLTQELEQFYGLKAVATEQRKRH